MMEIEHPGEVTMTTNRPEETRIPKQDAADVLGDLLALSSMTIRALRRGFEMTEVLGLAQQEGYAKIFSESPNEVHRGAAAEAMGYYLGAIPSFRPKALALFRTAISKSEPSQGVRDLAAIGYLRLMRMDGKEAEGLDFIRKETAIGRVSKDLLGEDFDTIPESFSVQDLRDAFIYGGSEEIRCEAVKLLGLFPGVDNVEEGETLRLLATAIAVGEETQIVRDVAAGAYLAIMERQGRSEQGKGFIRGQTGRDRVSDAVLDEEPRKPATDEERAHAIIRH